jgi:hypothetical protein
MKVNGIHLDDEIAQAAMQEMMQEGSFTYIGLQAALVRNGAPHKTRFRGADRLLQKYRKRGDIMWDAKSQEWIVQR